MVGGLKQDLNTLLLTCFLLGTFQVATVLAVALQYDALTLPVSYLRLSLLITKVRN